MAAYILKHDDGESDDEDENVDVDAVVRWKMQQVRLESKPNKQLESLSESTSTIYSQSDLWFNA